MEKKLTICSPQLGIAPESNSGGEVYDREVIGAFCKEGIKVIVILPKNKPYIPHKNLKVYYLPFPFVYPPYLFNIFIIPYLFWLYKKENFDILRIHSPYFVGLGALFFKLFYPKIALVVTYHHLEEKKPLYHLINKLILGRWDKIIAVSRFTKEEITKKYKIDWDKIKVVYNGVTEKFKPGQKNKNLVKKYNLEEKEVLLFLGELKPRKNVHFLLEIMSRINLSNVKLLICGKGKSQNSLIEKSRKLKIEDKVAFVGFVSEKEKVDYYNLADIFLFPSKKEGFGMPIIEAASCGVPSIASNISSLKELILDGKTGYLAEFNNLADWQEKIKVLLKNEKLRNGMVKTAQKFSQNFSWQKSVQEQIKIYKELLIINH